MALNPDRAGHRYPPFRYEICAEKVREYADATGARGGDVPPTFAALFAVTRAGGYVFDDPELGATARLMHGNQEFDFHRTVRPGDVLECRPRITRILSRRGSEFLTLQVDCVDAGTGEPVVTSRQTVVFLPGRDG